MFFSMACPLCRKEIVLYQRTQPAEAFKWIDISDPSVDLEHFGVQKSTAAQILHVIDDDGKIKLGIDAFILIWKKFPELKWLGHILSAPLIRQLSAAGYYLFANTRPYLRTKGLFNRHPE